MPFSMKSLPITACRVPACKESSCVFFLWLQFFHYSQGQVYPGNYPPFKDRTSWAGDLDKKDASINIENMQFIHNGTYICDVKNPPDIVAQPGHIRLYVVEKGTSLSVLAVVTQSPLSQVQLKSRSDISEYVCLQLGALPLCTSGCEVGEPLLLQLLEPGSPSVSLEPTDPNSGMSFFSINWKKDRTHSGWKGWAVGKKVSTASMSFEGEFPHLQKQDSVCLPFLGKEAGNAGSAFGVSFETKSALLESKLR